MLSELSAKDTGAGVGLLVVGVDLHGLARQDVEMGDDGVVSSSMSSTMGSGTEVGLGCESRRSARDGSAQPMASRKTRMIASFMANRIITPGSGAPIAGWAGECCPLPTNRAGWVRGLPPISQRMEMDGGTRSLRASHRPASVLLRGSTHFAKNAKWMGHAIVEGQLAILFSLSAFSSDVNPRAAISVPFRGKDCGDSLSLPVLRLQDAGGARGAGVVPGLLVGG